MPMTRSFATANVRKRTKAQFVELVVQTGRWPRHERPTPRPAPNRPPALYTPWRIRLLL